VNRRNVCERRYPERVLCDRVSGGLIRSSPLRNLDTKTFQSCGGSGTVSRQVGFICLGVALGNDANMCRLKYRVIVYENVKINFGRVCFVEIYYTVLGLG